MISKTELNKGLHTIQYKQKLTLADMVELMKRAGKIVLNSDNRAASGNSSSGYTMVDISTISGVLGITNRELLEACKPDADWSAVAEGPDPEPYLRLQIDFLKGEINLINGKILHLEGLVKQNNIIPEP